MSDLQEDHLIQRRRRKILDNAEDRFAKISGVAASIRSDDLEAERRERRRQKILRNADARIAKITGLSRSPFIDKEVTEETPTTEGVRARSSPVSGVSLLSQGSQSSGVSLDSEAKVSFCVNSIHRPESKEEIVQERLRKRIEVSPQENASIVFAVFTLLLWVILAAVVRLLITSKYESAFGETIFLPFAVMEFTLIIARRLLMKTTQSGGMVHALLLLCGVNSHATHLLTQGAEIMMTGFCDLGLYIVSFILIHCTVVSNYGEKIHAVI